MSNLGDSCENSSGLSGQLNTTWLMQTIPSQSICPHCGYCDKCGRQNNYTYYPGVSYYPYYTPYVPYYGQITWTCGTSQAGQAIS